jgi:malonate-semialdehyde dehydrogenase (acetylating)/methylmalonate-semialdehyde dehydrogenase
MSSPIPIYIDGQWITPKTDHLTPVYNPSTGAVIAHTPLCGSEIVDKAVQSAQKAFPEWSETPPAERARVLMRFKMLVEQHFDELCRCVSKEHGKTLSEARGDVQRGIEQVEFACGIPSLLMGESLENVARGIDCDSIRQPLGVCAGIAPFNFPAMVPLWMWPLAIACGNTFIMKPSEKVPLTSNKMMELLEKAGLPAGVLNIIHGGRDCVEALLAHPHIKAISFVGSTAIARSIYEHGAKYGKRVQAAGGAKNFVVVMPDADVNNTTIGLRDAAFGCAGERCMAGSTAIVIGNAEKTVLPNLVDAVKAMKVGPTDRDNQPHMGAVISDQHRQRIINLINQGEKFGGHVLVDGRKIKVEEEPNGFYVGPTIVDQVQWGTPLMNEEVFGPVLNVMHAQNLEEAINLANRSAYGNGASIFTSSGKAAREFRHRAQAGMIGINVGVPATLAYFPFSGWNESFFGDLHIQGKEGVAFYTRQKVTTSRWFNFGEGDVWAK